MLIREFSESHPFFKTRLMETIVWSIKCCCLRRTVLRKSQQALCLYSDRAAQLTGLVELGILE